MSTPRRIAVVGGGWAGLAAAVACCAGGASVTLFEMAPQVGGRARSVASGVGANRWVLDNGQHILIGAYQDSLALMRTLGMSIERVLQRAPLRLVDVDGRGLALPPGPAWWAFARGVMAARHWRLRDRLALLRVASGWALRGFTCEPSHTVGDLSVDLPPSVRRDLIDPLCVAALNTPADSASGTVFLRVLRDALFRGQGSSDLLLPRVPLSELLADPAQTWLVDHGAKVSLRTRVQSLVAGEGVDGGWLVDGEAFDAVILACTAGEAARLTSPLNPSWAAVAARVHYQSIVTVYLWHADARLPAAMATLEATSDFPAQFVFDHGQLTQRPGLLAFVISGANDWLAKGLDATVEATLAQARQSLPAEAWVEALTVVGALAERRATFACVPGLDRPPAEVKPGLWAAGDYVAGPYPSTLEGAVRTGSAAAKAALAPRG